MAKKKKKKRNDFLKQEYVINNGYNYLVIDCRKQNLKKSQRYIIETF